MKPTELVKDYARRQVIDPARRNGNKTVRIVAGEIHKALGFTNRVPLVCNALASKGFLKENRLHLESRQGPPSGLSTTVVFTYRLENGGKPEESRLSSFLRYRGAGREVFQALGGGEAFIQSEREQFDASMAKDKQ